MLGRKTFTREEIDRARDLLSELTRGYDELATAVAATADAQAAAALERVEPLLGSMLLLALDRPFVHRIRAVTGKGGTPLNELELLVDAVSLHGGVLTGNNVIKYVPEQAVLGLSPGDRVSVTRDDVARLAAGVFSELEEKFV
ncbi:MAG: hypothetical protein U0R50_16740 [Gaiellales bacterium]